MKLSFGMSLMRHCPDSHPSSLRFAEAGGFFSHKKAQKAQSFLDGINTDINLSNPPAADKAAGTEFGRLLLRVVDATQHRPIIGRTCAIDVKKTLATENTESTENR